jgi:2'-5' RNA ligase
MSRKKSSNAAKHRDRPFTESGNPSSLKKHEAKPKARSGDHQKTSKSHIVLSRKEVAQEQKRNNLSRSDRRQAQKFARDNGLSPLEERVLRDMGHSPEDIQAINDNYLQQKERERAQQVVQIAARKEAQGAAVVEKGRKAKKADSDEAKRVNLKEACEDELAVANKINVKSDGLTHSDRRFLERNIVTPPVFIDLSDYDIPETSPDQKLWSQAPKGDHNTSHYFVAIKIDKSLTDKFNQLASVGPSEFRWTDPDNYHITLAFTGRMTPQKLDEVTAELSAVKKTSFKMRLDGIGAFLNHEGDNKSHKGVLYAKPDTLAAMNINLLSRKIKDTLQKCGIDIFQPKDLKPHMTLARVAKKDQHKLKEMNKKYADLITEDFNISSFQILELLQKDDPRSVKKSGVEWAIARDIKLL